MTTKELRELTIQRALQAIKDFGAPLTLEGIADELDLPTYSIPIKKMAEMGLIEPAEIIEGHTTWQIKEP